MCDLTIGQLARIVHGRLRLGAMPPLGGEWEPVRRLVTRSSEAAAGDVVFVNEADQRQDSCVQEAFARGALGAVVAGSRDEPWAGKFTIEVPHVGRALGRLGRWAREQFTGHLIGVSGTVGATTAARLLHSVLQQTQRGVLLSLVDRRDEIEAWLTLLQANQADYGIVVLPAPQAGIQDDDADQLRFRGLVMTGWHDPLQVTDAACPHLGLLETHAAPSHDASWLICNGDDGELYGAARRLFQNVKFVGRSSRCDVVATQIRQDAGRLTFQANGHSLELPWGVRQQVIPALAAYAVGGRQYGVPSMAIRAALQQGAAAGGVPAPRRAHRGATLLRNVHHGAPAAALAGLEALRDHPAPGRRMVVALDLTAAGDPQAASKHQLLGDAVVTRCGADILIAGGTHARETASGALRAGMPVQRIIICSTADELSETLEPQLNADDVVLVSGKDALGVDQILNQLCPARMRAAAA